MRKDIFKKVSVLLLTAVFVAAGLTGCGKSSGNDAGQGNRTDDSVTVIKVGTGTGYPPMWYEDENGNLTGYCVEVLRAIDEKLPEYKFEFEPSSDITGVLVSLDSEKISIGEFLFNKSEEREEKYLFGEEGYYFTKIYIGALADRDDLNSIEDFAGKVVGVVQGDVFTTVLEQYNADHPGQEIILEYINWGTDEENLSLLTSGRVDGLCNIGISDVEKWKYAYGNGEAVVKTVGDPVIESASYLLFRKDDTALQEATDKALAELQEDGTLSELSIQFLGLDFSK